MLILPAIDIRGGNCVRLTQGDYAREKVYDVHPLSVAERFAEDGAEWLHVIDLDGAKSGVPQNLAAVEEIAKKTGLNVQFGGGVRSLETAASVLAAGAARFVVGTKLIEEPSLAGQFFQEFGDRVVAGIDARHGKVAIGGWLDTSGEDAGEVAVRVQRQGAARLVLTDIGRDGTLQGPNLELLKRVSSKVSIPVIQSGGISSLEDVSSLLSLGDAKPEAVIVGKALYENRFSLREALSLADIRANVLN
ncbi:MAG TPA: 1-(5-phosphoribosyl)-5-[(5-phosphoribosylamino)methylideneamino]imidazole-4-carboxamide isomerase [Fimbriimonas sp.]|nr:1-(5-phosphoribosyl)-5-[(5-phosphoribosylamino)methylideneamino]imidazole-4-carboxamide isomerase [Fimbriimonas sp.]